MTTLPFGKHRGKDVDDCPSDYLRWLVKQDFVEDKYPEILKAAEDELKYRDTWRKHFYDD